MAETINLLIDLPVSTERVYRAWTDGYETSQFTGSPAKMDATVGGTFTLQDGYIHGTNQVLTPFSHIVQTWRAADFPPGVPASQVDIRLEPTCLGAQLTLGHSGIPDGQPQKYMQWWVERFLKPLRDYFEKLVGETSVDMDG